MTKEICGIFLGKELEAIFFLKGKKENWGKGNPFVHPRTYLHKKNEIRSKQKP